MAVPLGLLLALLGCTTALDPALDEAWEGWKSLHAKEYPGVGPASLWGGLTQRYPSGPIPCPRAPGAGSDPAAPRQEAEPIRREVWEKNLRRIQQHNWEQSQGQHGFRLAMNHHGDLVPQPPPPGHLLHQGLHPPGQRGWRWGPGTS